MIDLLTLDELFAQNYVRRYHMVRVSREQSVLEHSTKVAYIASKLLKGYAQFAENNLPDSSTLVGFLRASETKLAVLELGCYEN